MSAKEKGKAADADLRTNEKKWSKPLIEAGYTVFPTVIIENQRQLGLDAVDVNILMHLASKWWKAEGKPYPSKGTIAQAMNLDPRTVQRRIAALEKAGYVRREERRGRWRRDLDRWRRAVSLGVHEDDRSRTHGDGEIDAAADARGEGGERRTRDVVLGPIRRRANLPSLLFAVPRVETRHLTAIVQEHEVSTEGMARFR